MTGSQYFDALICWVCLTIGSLIYAYFAGHDFADVAEKAYYQFGALFVFVLLFQGES